MIDIRSRSSFPPRALGAVMLAALPALAACGDGPTEVEFEVIEEVTFASSLMVDLTQMTMTNTGVYYVDEVVGTGRELEFGLRAVVDYEGYLVDGTLFDQDTGLDYLMGNRDVVGGLEDGSLGMNVGGTRFIIIPPNRGYGSAGNGPVPPGAIMLFRITLTDVLDI